MLYLLLAIVMLNTFIAEGTNEPASYCSNHWHSKMSDTLNDFIVKVRLQWVCVIMKYVCQFVCQLSLVVYVKLVLSHFLPSL